MLVGDNYDEYRHPELYDLENPDSEPEREFYLSVARELGGPVLELGCGTGRLTLPLAQNGIDITGIEVVPEMLAQARLKGAGLSVRWVEADVRDFHLDQKFNLIFETGSVFMHMLSNADQDAFLARVREHLAPGGRFIFSLWFPHAGSLEAVPEEKEWYTYQDNQGRTVRVGGTEDYDEIRQVKRETAIRHIIDPDGTETVLVAPLYLRYTFPQEMERLLPAAGFHILERCGGPDRSPLTPSSQVMTYLVGLKD